jgi:phage host-nuclease inhibitor protein Gam
MSRPETREEAERRMGEFAAQTVETETLRNEMESRIQDVRAEYEARLIEAGSMLEEMEADLKAWGKANEKLCGDGRAIEMVHGTIEFREGQPQCRLRKGVKEEEVKAKLINRDLGYTRTVVEVDRERLIADREKLGEAFFERIGMQVVQVTRIHVEPKRESVAAVA